LRIVSVACSSAPPPPELVAKAREFVDELASSCGKSVAIALGGYWGLMRVVADRAIEKGLTVIIMPPLEREDTEFPSQAIVVKTGVSYRVRSVFLVRTGDALVALGGSSGTMQEVLTAYCEAKPIYILLTGLESDNLAKLGPYIDARKLTKLKFYEDPRKLARDLAKEIGCSNREPNPAS